MEIRADNVNGALSAVLYALEHDVPVVYEDTRNGRAVRIDEPVTVIYSRPWERVLFGRKCNPIFHVYEAMWMLAGRNDVDPLASILPRMREFSDDGMTFHGAYGHRWRKHFGADQLAILVEVLQRQQGTRRGVLQMWDSEDLVRVMSLPQCRDVPCNLCATFQQRGESLDMHVFNRSNDGIWGMFGANYVHFSFLQAFVAELCGLKQGRMIQTTTNLHFYEKTLKPERWALNDWYAQQDGRNRRPYKLGLTAGTVEKFAYDPWKAPPVEKADRLNFLHGTAVPMMWTWSRVRAGEWDTARRDCEDIEAEDWRMATEAWVHEERVRREKEKVK